jgi:glycosyltransferase involved in cell wall biosynthesis
LQKPTEFLSGQFLRSFKVWITWALRLSDTLIFTSDSQYQYFKTYNFGYRGSVEVLDLGSSIVGPIMPSPQRSRFGLLAVSTIEPRKRYVEILDAFDVLRALGFPVTLDIVGRYGWLQEELRERILAHDNYGECLRWHENCSDAELTDLYRRTSITIMASRDEGWGLALEEGLRHGHKIVARDIPIFRKRENPNVLFFDQSAPLAETIASALFQPWKRMKIQRTMMDFSRDLIQIVKSLV